jgi:hypothetical protein
MMGGAPEGHDGDDPVDARGVVQRGRELLKAPLRVPGLRAKMMVQYNII